MNYRRFFRSFFMTLLSLTLVCSVTAMAATPIPFVHVDLTTLPGLEIDELLVDTGKYYEFPVLDMASRTKAEQEEWVRIMDSFQGKRPGFFGVCVLVYSSQVFGIGYQHQVYFASLEESSLTYYGDDNSYFMSFYSDNADYVVCTYQPQRDIFIPSFFDRDGLIFCQNFKANPNSQKPIVLFQAGSGSYDPNSLVQPASGMFNYLYYSIGKGVLIHDNLGDAPPDSSSEPDPPDPSIPSEPDIPFVPPAPPSFGGGGSGYLPYDPSIFEALVWYLRDAVGSAGRVLILIVFLTSAIGLVFSMIRHALSGGSSDGGGSGLL